MRYKNIGLFLIVAGFILFIVMGIAGIAHIGIFIIFPFIVSDNIISAIPMAMVFIGILFIFMPSFDIGRGEGENTCHEDEKQKSENKVGGFLMIGPIPIIFGNDKKLIYISMLIAAILILVYVSFIFHLL
ncbi:MAG: DUF131 domain-containing protein [Ferroplasma sp.]